MAVVAVVAAFYVGPLVSNWVSTAITSQETWDFLCRRRQVNHGRSSSS
jgi:hypothetical protein